MALAFGQTVRRLRDEREETLEKLAERIPGPQRKSENPTMDARYLGEIERGWHVPSIVTAKQIADALEVSLSDLVRDL